MSAQSCVRANMNPIDFTSSRSCAVCEQIVGPKPEEWISGRTGPISDEKSAESSAKAAADKTAAAVAMIFFISCSLGFQWHADYTKNLVAVLDCPAE